MADLPLGPIADVAATDPAGIALVDGILDPDMG